MNRCDSISHGACTGCGSCFNSCPKKAISMVEDKEGFFFPSISETLCIDCGLCFKVCPQSEPIKEKTPNIRAYYGYNKDKRLVAASSSGGIFVALAQEILKKGGVIFGAYFDFKSKELVHKSTDEVSLEALLKSKYVQSNIGDSFLKAKEELRKGRYVLFVGSPCQIAGFHHYLNGMQFDNLLTCDFVCHGVPPMRLLREHVAYLGFPFDTIHSIDFRKKVTKWVDRFRIETNFGNVYDVPWKYDAYYNFFEYGLSQRMCCYNCNYMKGYRESDITLADFWGYKSVDDSIYRKEGLSMIIAFTEKGKMAVDELKNRRIEIRSMNSSITEYAFKDDNKSLDKRTAFYNEYITHGYKQLVSNRNLTKQRAKRKMIVDTIKYYIVNIKRKILK